MNHFYQGFGIVVGVIAGVVAGTLVTVVIGWIGKWKNQKQRNKNLKFEFKFDIAKIQSFKAQLNNYRDAVNGDALTTYFGYFDLSKLIYGTAQSMYADGSLYKFFDEPNDLVKLQKAFNKYSAEWELAFNNKIKENREICGTEEWVKVKPDIATNIRFFDVGFQEDIDILKEFLTKLK